MIYTVEVGYIIATNAYFYIDDETRHGFLIDAGAEPERLLHLISENNFIIEKILLTHGHFDHIGAAAAIQQALNIPICMQKNGKTYAENTAWNLSTAFGSEIILDDVTYIEDYSKIILSTNKNFKLKIIPCAGHTTDGAIYYSEKDCVAFVGDSIFKGSFGRTDLPGGDEKTLFENIKTQILTLPDDTVLLSGHSEPTTVAVEKNRAWFN